MAKKDKSKKDKDVKATASDTRTAAKAIRNQALGFTLGLAATAAISVLHSRRRRGAVRNSEEKTPRSRGRGLFSRAS